MAASPCEYFVSQNTFNKHGLVTWVMNTSRYSMLLF